MKVEYFTGWSEVIDHPYVSPCSLLFLCHRFLICLPGLNKKLGGLLVLISLSLVIPNIRIPFPMLCDEYYLLLFILFCS